MKSQPDILLSVSYPDVRLEQSGGAKLWDNVASPKWR